MLAIIIQSIIALLCSIYTCKTLNERRGRKYMEWHDRADRARFAKPVKNLPLLGWILYIVLGSISVFPVAFRWSWLMPAIIGLVLIIVQLFVVKNHSQRQTVLFMTIPYATSLAFCLTSKFFAWIGYLFLGLVVIFAANLIKNKLLLARKNKKNEVPEETSDEEAAPATNNESEDSETPSEEEESEENSEEETEGKSHSWLWWLLAGLALIAIVLGLIFGLRGCGKDDKAPTENFDSLVVMLNHNDLVKMFPNWDGKLWDNQFMSQSKARTEASGFSDAVDFPFKEGDKLAQIQQLIIHSPVYADMVARGLKDIKLSTGKTIGELNPWLVEFVQKNDEAMKGKDGWTVWMKKSEDGKTLVFTDDYFDYAAKLAALLGNLKVTGEEARQSTEHYCLPLIEDNSKVRTEKVDNKDWQENKKALILEYVRKDNRGTEFVVGFNSTDKRFERFEVKTETPKSSTPTTSSTPKTPSQPKTPTKPTPKPTPTKDTSKDPVNQGNAEVGGGKNKPDDGAGKFQPKDPTTEKTEATRTTDDSSKKSDTRTTQDSKKTETTKPQDSSYAKVDDNYQKDPAPTTVNSDSHDNASQNAGKENGAFTMP